MANNLSKIDSGAVAQNGEQISDADAEKALKETGIEHGLLKIGHIRARQKVGKVIASDVAGKILCESAEAIEQYRKVRQVIFDKIVDSALKGKIETADLTSLSIAMATIGKQVNDEHATMMKCAEITGIGGQAKRQQSSAPSVNMIFSSEPIREVMAKVVEEAAPK